MDWHGVYIYLRVEGYVFRSPTFARLAINQPKVAWLPDGSCLIKKDAQTILHVDDDANCTRHHDYLEALQLIECDLGTPDQEVKLPEGWHFRPGEPDTLNLNDKVSVTPGIDLEDNFIFQTPNGKAYPTLQEAIDHASDPMPGVQERFFEDLRKLLDSYGVSLEEALRVTLIQ